MGIISYAQNFEDVILWRALQHVENGFYIDIGAHHPIVDSVSRAFYENGWRGMHAEPLQVYCDALRADRPDEDVLQVAVADREGSIEFYEIPDTGISTASKKIAESHAKKGFRVDKIKVPCMTLQGLFDLAGKIDIHWLKIDVEGLEKQVLQGWGASPHRPWIVVVESTLPLTQQESHRDWEGLLTARGYRFVYFDGLNRFYLSDEHNELEPAFSAGPNVFDGFRHEGSANNSFCQYVEDRQKEACVTALSGLTSEIDVLKSELAEKNILCIGLQEKLDSENSWKKIREESVAAMTELLSGMSKEIQARDSEIALLFQSISEIRNDYQSRIEAGAASMASLLSEMERSAQAKDREIQALLGEISDVRSEYQSRLDREGEQRKLSEATAASMASLLSEMERSAQAKDREIQALLGEISDVRSEYQSRLDREGEQRKLSEATAASMASLLSEMERSAQAKDREIQALLGEISDVRSEYQSRLDREGEQRKLSEATAASMASLLSEMERSAQAKDREIQALLGEISDVRSEYQSRLDREGEQRKLSEATAASMASLLSEMERSAQAKDLEIRTLHQEAMTSRENHQLKLEQLSAEVSRKSQQINDLTYRVADYENRIRVLQSTVYWKMSQFFRRMTGIGLIPTILNKPLLRKNNIKYDNGPNTVSDQMSNASFDDEFIDMAYRKILGRNPDPSGKSHYLDMLSFGIHRREVLRNLLKSKEARLRLDPKYQLDPDNYKTKSDSEFLNMAYHAILGRPVDPDGLENYLIHLRLGMSRKKVLQSIASSEEAERYRPEVKNAALLAKRLGMRYGLLSYFRRFHARDSDGILEHLQRIEAMVQGLSLQIKDSRERRVDIDSGYPGVEALSRHPGDGDGGHEVSEDVLEGLSCPRGHQFELWMKRIRTVHGQN